MWVLKVALPLPLEPMSYLPPHTDGRAPVHPGEVLGYRVVVPWRSELRVGVVVGREEAPQKAFALREALAYLDQRPWLDHSAIEFLSEAARDSFCPLGTLLHDLLPFLEPPLLHRVRLLPEASPAVLPRGLEALGEGWQEARGFDPRLLDYLREAGVLQEEVQEWRSLARALVVLREPSEKLSEKAKTAWYALRELGQAESMASLARATGVGVGVVKGLLEDGYIGFVEVEPAPETPATRPLEAFPLGARMGASPEEDRPLGARCLHRPEGDRPLGEQRVQPVCPEGDRPAAEQPKVCPEGDRPLGARAPARPEGDRPPQVPVRLQGGRLLERLRVLVGQIQEGPALVLFPEVSLLKKCQPFFPDATVLHGEMKAEERRRVWAQVGLGKWVLATYQGLLLPLSWERIVVMEEAAPAYKLPGGSRAFVPRLARLRAQGLGVPIHYCSSVNSAEVWDEPAYSLPPPRLRLHLLDLRRERGWPLTGAALALLQQVQEKNRQAIVLSARRGYSAVLRCKRCDWKAMCSNCALPLRYHKGGRLGLLQCHQCGHEEKAPELCPSCHSDVFDPRGPGVEWLLEVLERYLPTLPRYRYTAEAKDHLGPLLAGEPGVLVGTTAVLRAPVLPELALVLLPYADGFVLETDFRAAERYHRLLWQLADLHPQRHPLLVLQTFEPAHTVHQALQAASPQAFMEVELALRRTLGYPPASRMVKLEVTHAKEPVARDAIYQLAQAIKAHAQPGELLGPAPAPVARLRGRYVFHLLLKSSEARIQALMAQLPPVRAARLKIDPDPQVFVGLLED